MRRVSSENAPVCSATGEVEPAFSLGGDAVLLRLPALFAAQVIDRQMLARSA